MISVELLQFRKELYRDTERIVKQFNAAVTGATLLGFKRATTLTPVDTGRARASWEIGVNRHKYINLKKAPRGTRVYDDPTPRVFKFDIRKHHSIFLSNNVEYIEHLEHGSTYVAPRNMLGTATTAMKRSLNVRLSRIR